MIKSWANGTEHRRVFVLEQASSCSSKQELGELAEPQWQHKLVQKGQQAGCGSACCSHVSARWPSLTSVASFLPSPSIHKQAGEFLRSHGIGVGDAVGICTDENGER